MKYPDIKNFDFTFESQGTKFILEDIVRKFYLPKNSVGIVAGGKDCQYIGKSTVEEMKKTGERRRKDDTVVAGKKIKLLCAQARELKHAYSDKSKLTREETERVLLVLQSIVHEYFYFDYSFWDGAFFLAATDTAIRANVELVERLKNELRIDLEEFFGEDSLLNVLLDTLAKQTGISSDELVWYTQEEILGIFEGNKVASQTLEAHRTSVYWHDEENGLHIFYDGAAEVFIRAFNENSESESVNTITGRVAHGLGKKVTGRVRVLKRHYGDSEALERGMKEMGIGDILVSQTTDPQFMPAFYKAAAVVTDVGGMLSHAAISARELDIPCIVETKNASKIFKTGDFVEVDAEKGIVRKMK